MAEQTYALIKAGVVQQLIATDQDISTMFAPGLQWVAVALAGGIEPGYLYDGTNFSAPVLVAAPALGMSLSQLQADLAGLQSAIAEFATTH